MCGICGFLGDGNEAVLAAMTRALAHRGPDGEGLFVDRDARLFLGHRRLAVIDIAGGEQPMWNEDQTVAVVFNGEIYNHAELRRTLERLGHRFRSDHSDTEVLVHGYEEWGEGLPGRLNGMFAFAVYDQLHRSLFLARDRFGEKPLYYTRQNGVFAFASELGAFRHHPALALDVDPAALQKLFAYGFIPAPHAFYRDCRKLPGGSWLSCELATGETRIQSYWRFRIEPDDALGRRGDDRLAEELRHLLAQAVERRLVADVPLGIFLSGGIDSGTVLGLAATRRPAAELHSFTIGFDDPSFDESGYANDLARAIGSQHRSEMLRFDRARQLVDDVLARMDEPFGDASILPTYLLCGFTRRHVTVALSGDGGDELFCGYDPFRALGPAQLYERVVPAPVHRGLRRLADALPISYANMSLDFKLRRSLAGLSYASRLWNPVWLAPVEPDRLAHLFEHPLPTEELYAEALALWHGSPGLDLVDRTLEFYTNLYLQDDILVKADRAAMMHSLESRAVFLDNDVVEFCRRLPNRFKYRSGRRKYLLKKAVAGLLPPSVLQRRKKGFGIPLARWLRQMPAPPPPLRLPGVDTAWMAGRWQAHQAGRADERFLLWLWLCVQRALEGAPEAATEPVALRG